MQETVGSIPHASTAGDGHYIYIAGPWAPMGGGMYRVAEYLIQSQAPHTPVGAAQLRPLDTRGGGSALSSLRVLFTALAKVARGRLSGDLAGVHVNMAERLSVVRKGAIVVACRVLGIPVVLHLHAAQLHHFYRALPLLLQRLTRWVFSLPAGVVVLGPAAQRFVTEELRVPRQRVDVVINGVPGPQLQRPARVAGPPQRVLFLGNLSERKGVSDLLQALALTGLGDTQLEVVLAGGGDIAGYRAKAVDLGVEGMVRFAGWCDQQEVGRLMAQTDVLVLPSYDEGLPLVILEALAHGVAVVCTPVGEIPAVLSDGVNACFVEPGDIDGIAAALQKLLREPGLLETLGRNGRALYERQFSLARFFNSVARIHRRHFGIAGQPLHTATPSREAAP